MLLGSAIATGNAFFRKDGGGDGDDVDVQTANCYLWTEKKRICDIPTNFVHILVCIYVFIKTPVGKLVTLCPCFTFESWDVNVWHLC